MAPEATASPGAGQRCACADTGRAAWNARAACRRLAGALNGSHVNSLAQPRAGGTRCQAAAAGPGPPACGRRHRCCQQPDPGLTCLRSLPTGDSRQLAPPVASALHTPAWLFGVLTWRRRPLAGSVACCASCCGWCQPLVPPPLNISRSSLALQARFG